MEAENKKEDIKLAIKFILIGAIIFTIGIIIFFVATSSNNRVKTEGKISEEIIEYTRDSEGKLETKRIYYVTYMADGLYRTSRLLFGFPLLGKGKRITVYYYKKFPEFVVTRLMDLYLLIIPAIGIFVAVIGIMKLNEINNRVELNHL